jgi:iron complex outermembrane receptor protein
VNRNRQTSSVAARPKRAAWFAATLLGSSLAAAQAEPPRPAPPGVEPLPAAPAPSVAEEPPAVESAEGGEAAAAATPEDAAATAGAAPSSEAPEPVRSLSDVLVTAQKREEKVQDVPTPITVVSGAQLLEQSINTSNDIERISPNLSGQASGSRNSRPRWFLRGIGTNDPSLNLESPIGIYQDEIFIAYVPLQSFPLFDLERVEVLKGPQGTLWGKNTTGGAIHFVSQKPSFDASGYAQGTFGSYGGRGMQGGFGGPVAGEWLAARAAFHYEEQAGWATNLRDGSRDPEYTDFAGRLQLLANVGDDLDILVSGRFRLLTGGTAPIYPVGVGPGGAIRQYPMAPSTYTPQYGADPQIGDPSLRGPGQSQLQSTGLTATVNWHLGDYTATSISAVDTATNDSASFGYWPDPSFDQTGAYSQVESRQLTQELRLTSPEADALSWIAGLHYFNWHLSSDSASAIFGPVAARQNYVDNRFLQDNVSYAAFASAKLDVSRDFAITAGARYTHDRKEVQAQRFNGNGEELVFTDVGNWFDPLRIGSPLNSALITPTKGWSQLTYDVTPEYSFTDDILAYVRFAKGFRAGTFNPTILPGNAERAASLPRADPELLYDLEVGIKSAWLSDRLVVNAAAFQYWLTDVQLNVQQPNPNGIPNANTSSVQNAAGGRVTGGELEIAVLPVPELALRAGVGLLKAEYTDFITYQGTETVDASGNDFYRTPRFSGAFGAELRLPVSADSEIGIGTDWVVRTRIYHNAVVQDDPVQETPAYAIGNLEARFSTGGGRFTLQGYVRNVTDLSYKILSQVVNGGAYPTSLGIPRTFGLQLIARF